MTTTETNYPISVRLDLDDLLIIRRALMTLIQEIDARTKYSSERRHQDILKVGNLLGRLHALRIQFTGRGDQAVPRYYTITVDHTITLQEMGAAIGRKWRRHLQREERQPIQTD